MINFFFKLPAFWLEREIFYNECEKADKYEVIKNTISFVILTYNRYLCLLFRAK